MTDQTPDPWRDVQQRDETIRQLQDAFARCQEVQQATAETWRIEHDQMAEQIRLLRGAMAADDERLRRAAEQAGILYVSCDTAEALAEQITRLSAQVGKKEQELQTLHDNVYAALHIALSNDGTSAFVDGVGEVSLKDLFLAADALLAERNAANEAASQWRDKLAQVMAERDAAQQEIEQLRRQNDH